MKVIRILILGAFCFATSSVFAQSQETENLRTTPFVVSQSYLNQIIESGMEAEHISGLSASVFKDGEKIWEGTFGRFNREQNRDVTDSTSFLLYSVSKTFTGIALMQLHALDSFELDAPINNYLPFEVNHPDFPNSSITFRMLMSHVSGIKDNWTVINGLMLYNEDTPVSMADFLEDYFVPTGAYYNDNLSFTNSEPGTHFAYSNVGVTLAGYLVELISGMPFHTYVYSKILEPLGMGKSKYYLSEMDTAQLAMEYKFYGNQYHPSGFKSCPLLPAGFLHSSLKEMNNYLQMLMNHGTYNGVTILDSALLASMLVEQYPTVAPNAGLIFGFNDDDGAWGHTGGSSGVKTGFYFHKDEKWGLNLLSNGGGEPWQIFNLLFQYMRDYAKLTPTEIALDDANHNLIFEANEMANTQLKMRNNGKVDFTNLTAVLSCQNPIISLVDSVATVGGLLSGQETVTPVNFNFLVGNVPSEQHVDMSIKFYENGNYIDQTVFDVFVGQADILVIDDEEHFYKNRVEAGAYYQTALDELNVSSRTYDLNLYGEPPCSFLQGFEAVFWYTGLDNGNHTIMSSSEQQLITDYLDGGGHLFICGQNLADSLVGTVFLNHYLRSAIDNPDCGGELFVSGETNSPIGDAMYFYIYGGDGSQSMYAASSIAPVNGGEQVFHYSQNNQGAGVLYEGAYKLLFFPFGFESVNTQAKRTQLAGRILDFFNVPNSVDDVAPAAFEVYPIYPNPSDGTSISIEQGNSEMLNVSIADAVGKVVIRRRLSGQENQIDVSLLPVGSYIIYITGKEISESKKLMIVE